MCDDNVDYGKPSIIYVISGKRKSGKDYLATLLRDRFSREDSVTIRLSGPLKEQYALENNLDYAKLLDASEYKELYRHKMIKWGEDIRTRDPSYFCRHAILQSGAKSKKIWIVSDARRKSDVAFFLKTFPSVTLTIRISASESTRRQRGWEFTPGVDDCESECGLDDYPNWHFCLENNDDVQLMGGLLDLFESSSICMSNANPMELL